VDETFAEVIEAPVAVAAEYSASVVVEEVAAEAVEEPVAEVIDEVAAEAFEEEIAVAVKSLEEEGNILIAPGIVVPEDTVITIYEEMDGEYKGRATIDYTDIYIFYKAEVEMEEQRLEQPHPKIPYHHKIP